MQECHLPEAPLNAVWPQLDFEPGTQIERVGLRLGMEDEILVVLESDSLETPELSVEELEVSVAHLSPAGTLVLAGSDHILHRGARSPFPRFCRVIFSGEHSYG